MNEKILQAIKDSLPSIQAKELSNFFENYEAMEGENKTLKANNSKLEEEIVTLKKIDRDINILNEKEQKFKEEKEKFESDQRDAKVKELEYKLAYEQNGNKKVIDMLNVIFKNRFFNKAINGYTPEGCSNNNETIIEQEI